MAYIEREAAIIAIKNLYPSIPFTKLLMERWHKENRAYMECETAIENLPAADVRPVVICRDCIHYEMGVCLKIYDDGAANKDAWQERKPDDFCSYGEDRNVPTNCGADMREES